MRTIGMVEAVEAPTPKIDIENTTKQDMIQRAEAEGIELTPAEKRLNKERLAEVINGKR